MNPFGNPSTAWFQYSAPGFSGSTTPVSIGSGTNDVALSAPVSGFPQGMMYSYQIIRQNTNGTLYGNTETFDPGGTLTVTNLADNGPGTLRTLLGVASPAAIINFAPGLRGTVALTNNALNIIGNLTIVGPGPAALTISGTYAPCVFNALFAGTASISGLTISGGHVAGSNAPINMAESGESVSGGVIRNGGNLALSNCVISGNSAVGGKGSDSVSFGNDCGAGGAASGAAIRNSGNLTIVDCSLFGNTVISGAGGSGDDSDYFDHYVGHGGAGGTAAGAAIWNSGTATVINCIFATNSASGGTGGAGQGNTSGTPSAGGGGAGGSAFGAAIYNVGSVSIIGSTFVTNTAQGLPGGSGGYIGPAGVYTWAGGQGGYGGSGAGAAVYNGGTLSATNCSFVGNFGQSGCGGAGGNAGNGSYPGSGGNGGNGFGGAVETTGICSLVCCTIASNSVVASNGGIGGSSPQQTASNGANGQALGGGIHISTGGSVTLLNTIVAQDTGASPDASGTFTSQGHNLIGTTNGSSGWLASDLKGSITSPLNPLLGPLQNNGGPTLTAALLTGSPAIDAGDDAVLGPPASLTTDQRGYPRKSGQHVDIGAYEVQAVVFTPPSLNIAHLGTIILLFWPTNATGYGLQVNTNLNRVTWTQAPGTPARVAGQFQFVVTNSPGGCSAFYRLKTQ